VKILFASVPPVDRPYGGSKPAVELASELERLGWEADVVSLSTELPGEAATTRRARAEFLRELIRSRGREYDVVDFDHEYLPYPRSDFPEKTLLVARSVLLCQQVAARAFPKPPSVRGLVGAVTRGPGRRSNRVEMAEFADRTVREADLVNVSNDDDAELLAGRGVARERIVVLPYGLSAERRAAFEELTPERPHAGVVAFVGTFDWRKGAADLPAIVEGVVAAAPGTRFRLLGTSGMFRTAGDVLARFPRRLRSQVEVAPFYAADELPGLLAECAVGVFPSYLEGFPFAVLEMLAASLPVIAYDAPGAPMLLPEGWLAAPGDTAATVRKLADLLGDEDELRSARCEARERSRKFDWETIAARTRDRYAAGMGRGR
jgi:glycosyltransferase involved in cell wall biosynthesis